MIKTTKLKRQINSYIIDFLFKGNGRTKENTGKVLVIATDALGDVIVKIGLYDLVIKKYGKENVYFMFNSKWSQTMKKLGYKIFHERTKKEKYGLFARINLINKINRKKFEKIINLEVVEPEIPLKYLKSKEKIGFLKDKQENDLDNYLYTNKYGSIRIQLKDMGELILNRKIKIQEINPDLEKKIESIEKEEGIVISIGASNKKRICSVEQMIEIINFLRKEFPDEKITLLGTGTSQKKYAKKLQDNLSLDLNLEDKVGELNVYEVIKEINKSKFFLGFDSGLYNISYSLNKKTIGIFNHYSGFEHEVDNIQIIMCEMKRESISKNIIFANKFRNASQEEEYGTLKLNNFDMFFLRKALKNLELIGEVDEEKNYIS